MDILQLIIIQQFNKFMKKLKILSLFDGISGTQVALKNLGIEYDYYASEIDPYAIKVTQANFPNTIQLGDVKAISYQQSWGNTLYYDGGYFTDIVTEKDSHCYADVSTIDLLCGGSPCQSFSIAGSQKGFEDPRGQLFWEYVRILNEVKPRFFIFENVNSMKQRDKDIISKAFGFEPIVINSALVTAQQRKRLFYVGTLQEDGTYKKVEIDQPQDKGILLKDILESGLPYQDKSHALTASYDGAVFWNSLDKKQRSMILEPVIYSPYNKTLNKDGKSYSLGTNPQCQTAVAGQLVITPVRLGHFNKGGQGDRVYSVDGKSVCLSANGGGLGANTGLYLVPIEIPSLNIDKLYYIEDDCIYQVCGEELTFLYRHKCFLSLAVGFYTVRKLTVNECCRLQGFPDFFVDSISKSQGYKALGNSFTVPVIEHILKTILK
jgi:DNA (cytosine-5)-methyltransferase 3A